MSKTNNIEMQNAVYGIQNEVIQGAIRRAHRERAEAISELVRKIFRRSDTDEAAADGGIPLATNCAK